MLPAVTPRHTYLTAADSMGVVTGSALTERRWRASILTGASRLTRQRSTLALHGVCDELLSIGGADGTMVLPK